MTLDAFREAAEEFKTKHVSAGPGAPRHRAPLHLGCSCFSSIQCSAAADWACKLPPLVQAPTNCCTLTHTFCWLQTFAASTQQVYEQMAERDETEMVNAAWIRTLHNEPTFRWAAAVVPCPVLRSGPSTPLQARPVPATRGPDVSSRTLSSKIIRSRRSLCRLVAWCVWSSCTCNAC